MFSGRELSKQHLKAAQIRVDDLLRKVHGFLAMKSVDARDLQEFVCPACNHKFEGEIWRSHGGVKCPQCGIGFIQDEIKQRQKPTQSTDRGLSSLQRIGVLLLIGGLIVTGYFFLAFDTSVESGIGRVNNLGLMADRQNGIIIGIGLGIVGTIMLAIGSRGKN